MVFYSFPSNKVTTPHVCSWVREQNRTHSNRCQGSLLSWNPSLGTPRCKKELYLPRTDTEKTRVPTWSFGQVKERSWRAGWDSVSTWAPGSYSQPSGIVCEGVTFVSVSHDRCENYMPSFTCHQVNTWPFLVSVYSFKKGGKISCTCLNGFFRGANEGITWG